MTTETVTYTVLSNYLIISKWQSFFVGRYWIMSVRIPCKVPIVQRIRWWFLCVYGAFSRQWAGGSNIVAFHVSNSIAGERIPPVVIDYVASGEIVKGSHRMPLVVSVSRTGRLAARGSYRWAVPIATQQARECWRMLYLPHRWTGHTQWITMSVSLHYALVNRSMRHVLQAKIIKWRSGVQTW